MEVKKNPKSNLENFSKVFTMLGLVLALYVVYIAMEHKTYDNIVKELESVTLLAEDMEETIIMDIIQPPSAPPPPPPPPPPPTPEQFEKVEDDKIIEEVVIQTTEVEEDDVVEVDAIEYSEESEVVAYENVPFAAVQNPAIFPGCEKKKGAEARRKCMNKKIQKHIQKNFDTGLAEELGLSGIVRMAAVFKIDHTGKVADIMVRSKNAELTKEFKAAIKKLPQMVPASQNGRKVNVMYQLPLVFRVE